MAEPSSSSFPKGLRVLAVDDDKVALHILQQMLLSCNYQVTILERGKDALSIIREDRNRFDLVLCDLHSMPETDGFTLLRAIKSETDIPCVMMSSEYSPEVVMKGVINGACDFLVKPICIDQIRVIWQHVLRRRLNREMLESKSSYAEKLEEKQNDDEEEEEENEGSPEYGTKAKKPRIIWTTELHHKFIQAVHQLGADKAVPKRILECMQGMGVTKLTRENVASHLQKFRLNVRRMNEEFMEHSGNFSPFVNPNGFEQSSSSAHQFQFGEKFAMALQEQREILGPVTSRSGQGHDIIHGGVSTNLGFGSNKEQPLLGEAVQMGLEFQTGVGVTHHMHMLMQNEELGNIIACDNHQHDNYNSLYDGTIMTQQNLVANENSCVPFIQNDIRGELSSGQDSDHEVHLFAYEYAQE